MPLSLSDTALLINSAFIDHDVRAMRKINDRCIEETAIKYQQPTYLFALISYVLSKILSKPRYLKAEGAKDKVSQISALLRNCERQAKTAEYSSLIATQNKVLKTIEQMDDADRRFVKGILTKGRLKIASTLYAQGISLGNAVEIAGTDRRELMLYAGQTMMFDRVKEPRTITQRMKDLREIFTK
jgi:hypothetical protein